MACYSLVYVRRAMFGSEDHVEIPCVDVLIWAFGNEDYDQERPVSGPLGT